MTDRFAEYPCVKIDGKIHVTKSGSECKCGKEYEYSKHPIIRRTLSEVTCIKCRRILSEQNSQDKLLSSLFISD